MIATVLALTLAAAVQVGDCTTLADLGRVRSGGFDYAELRTSEIAALTDRDFDDLRRRLAREHLRVPVTYLFIPPEIALTGPAVDDARTFAYVRKALARVARLGTRTVVFGSGRARSFPDGFPKGEAERQLVAFCRRLGVEARRRGITIAIEPQRPEESNLVNSVAEAIDLVDRVHHPNIQIVVDFYHLTEVHEDPAVILRAGRRVRHVHMANPRGRVFPLNADEYGYRGFFDALKAIGYAGTISVEASTSDFAADAPRSVAFLRHALASP